MCACVYVCMSHITAHMHCTMYSVHSTLDMPSRQISTILTQIRPYINHIQPHIQVHIHPYIAPYIAPYPPLYIPISTLIQPHIYPHIHPYIVYIAPYPPLYSPIYIPISTLIQYIYSPISTLNQPYMQCIVYSNRLQMVNSNQHHSGSSNLDTDAWIQYPRYSILYIISWI